MTHFTLALPVAGICRPARSRVCGKDWTLAWVAYASAMSAKRMHADLGGGVLRHPHPSLSVMSGSGFWVSMFAWHSRLLPSALGTPSYPAYGQSARFEPVDLCPVWCLLGHWRPPVIPAGTL
jgi:hypothetical protein